MTDAIPQAIIVLNPDGRAIYANRVALEYSGLSLDDVRTDDFRGRVFHPDDVQRLRDERHKALSGTSPFENEQRVLGKDGKYRWFLIRYNPLLDESGKVIRWYATGTDIDDRKRAEDRLRNETVALREQIDRDSMFEDIVGSSEALRKVLHQVDKVAHSDSTVLILGETGTGKELIARHPQAIQPRGAGIYWCELCGNPRIVDRFRALWSRKGRLHWCDATAPGTLRISEWRDDFSWTKSAICPRKSKSHCYECCKNVRSNVSAVIDQFPLT